MTDFVTSDVRKGITPNSGMNPETSDSEGGTAFPRPTQAVAQVPLDLWEMIVAYARENDDIYLRVLVEKAVPKSTALVIEDV
jgi:hypothetical protein